MRKYIQKRHLCAEVAKAAVGRPNIYFDDVGAVSTDGVLLVIIPYGKQLDVEIPSQLIGPSKYDDLPVQLSVDSAKVVSPMIRRALSWKSALLSSLDGYTTLIYSDAGTTLRVEANQGRDTFPDYSDVISDCRRETVLDVGRTTKAKFKTLVSSLEDRGPGQVPIMTLEIASGKIHLAQDRLKILSRVMDFVGGKDISFHVNREFDGGKYRYPVAFNIYGTSGGQLAYGILMPIDPDFK